MSVDIQALKVGDQYQLENTAGKMVTMQVQDKKTDANSTIVCSISVGGGGELG